jgi:hypothetical protein
LTEVTSFAVVWECADTATVFKLGFGEPIAISKGADSVVVRFIIILNAVIATDLFIDRQEVNKVLSFLGLAYQLETDFRDFIVF